MKRLIPCAFLFAALAGCGNTGIICSDTEVRCGNTCANLQTNPDYCGSCGQACPTGFVCQSGACTCPSDLKACGQSCVNTQNSVANCGGCGQACPVGQVCESGTCKSSCSGSSVTCGGSCVDPTSDRENCGGCADGGGTVCGQGQTCLNGVCGSDLFAACYNSGELYALDAKGEVASPQKATAPPTNPVGLAFHGHDQLEAIDLTAASLYTFDLDGGFGASTSFAIGQGPNAIAISGDTAAVTNSTDGTLDVLGYATPGWARRCAGDAGCTASVNLGASTFPQYAAFGPDAIYVSLQGDTFAGGNPDTVGNKVVRVALADLSTQSTELNGLDLQAPDAGTQPRPQGLAYANGQVFVALANLAGYTAGAPGLVAVLDEPGDGGALVPHGQPIALGAGCVNAGAVLLNGTTLYVACGPQYDPVTYAPVKPGALAALDTVTLQPAFPPRPFACPSGATGCVNGGASRIALAAGKLFVGDTADGRLFVVDPDGGTLERGPDHALTLCPAPDGGFNFISDVVARP